MIATHAMINNLRIHGRIRIDRDLEVQILRRFGSEPLPFEYSEQDLHEQIRKLAARHGKGCIPGEPF